MYLNRLTVASTNLRLELHQLIDRVDENFLEAVHGVLQAYLKKDQVVGYDMGGSAVSANDFVAQAEEIVSSIKKGESGISMEELGQRSNEWLTSTK